MTLMSSAPARLNGAVIKGFEQDVGTKTSFYGFTVNTMKNSLIAYKMLGFTSVPQGRVRPPMGMPLRWTVGAMFLGPVGRMGHRDFRPQSSGCRGSARILAAQRAAIKGQGRSGQRPPCSFR